jgi:hypothetical protein
VEKRPCCIRSRAALRPAGGRTLTADERIRDRRRYKPCALDVEELETRNEARQGEGVEGRPLPGPARKRREGKKFLRDAPTGFANGIDNFVGESNRCFALINGVCLDDSKLITAILFSHRLRIPAGHVDMENRPSRRGGVTAYLTTQPDHGLLDNA